MNRMHAIVHAAAARLPAVDAVTGRRLQAHAVRLATSARADGYVRPRYAAGTLPSRFHVV
ncbi:hypothetical protein ACF3M1_16205 [Luteimonas sp. WGS1318]|uniref:hypothetical protein n=1 Tax=Luteimonas sp. WGS1318 TaxID=3366815 RepID=UPI00372D6437